jgi:hypothetical protein
MVKEAKGGKRNETLHVESSSADEDLSRKKESWAAVEWLDTS